MDKKSNYSIKNNSSYLKRRLLVLQNKPMAFRPTNQVKEFLSDKNNKSKVINEAIEQLIQSRDVDNYLTRLALRFPFNWRRVNRKNSFFITNKMKEMKNARL